MKTFAPVLWTCVALLFAGRILHAEDLWMENFKGAQEKAAKEGKDLLIDFTGSDWCGWCIRLKKEVFDKDEFKKEATKNYIFVELDYPHQKELPADIKTQNQKLQQDFGIEGFPSIILTDAKGRAYAKTGYKEGGPAAYLPHLAELQKQKTSRDESLAKAEKATGAEKAKLLDEALTNLEANAPLVGYQDLIQEIIKLDSANAAGLKKKYEDRQRNDGLRGKFGEIEASMQTGDMDATLQKADAFIKNEKPEGEFKQKALFLKAIILHQKKDKAGCIENLKSAQAADPKSAIAKQIPQIIQKIEADTASKDAAPKEAPPKEAPPKEAAK